MCVGGILIEILVLIVVLFLVVCLGRPAPQLDALIVWGTVSVSGRRKGRDYTLRIGWEDRLPTPV